ncbi:hypothetical protein PQO03_11040 [Lentisphaera profundi]|uniref:Periplasmic nitrate reductase, electron transfer subunit n=1 Tax=Lentisphaera profundi TaxID=1658616 RepID=A0ABY7VQG4_9BACT|nr:hypothetical protein [Lentisphaera profundi]WDE96242.1 hypothetical protein PQO03_11040 [Lentisphaera profundi]
MNNEKKFIVRLIKVALSLSLMFVLVFGVGNYLRKQHKLKDITVKVERLAPMGLIPQSKFQAQKVSSTTPLNATNPSGAKARSIKEYYKRRAYPGAPPHIPHPVSKEMQLTQNCNVCHEKGGYAPQFSSFTPVTPHPEYKNCLQCHGLNEANDLFKGSEWEKIDPPKLKQSALPGGPLQIPHSLQLRENCQACHSGPAALIEIRCPHPERVNCVQCHTPKTTPEVFIRSRNNLIEQKRDK